MTFGPIDDFPYLAPTTYHVTSRATWEYNCIGWAAEEDDRWWWPRPEAAYYWPAEAPMEETLAAFELAYATLGYAACNSLDMEDGFVKVAIYALQDGTPTHAARQLVNGHWTSKIGGNVDIEHYAVEAVQGPKYGTVALIMKRPL